MFPSSLDPDLLTWSYCLQFLVLMPLSIVAMRTPGQSWFEALDLKAAPAATLVRWVLLWLLSWLLAAFLYQQLAATADPFFTAVKGTKHLGLTVSSVLLAPLLEEVIFRGCAFKLLRHAWPGKWGTVLLTSLLFMLIHVGQYGPIVLALMFLLGVLLGVAREKSGSLLVPIILHSLNNLVSCILILWLGLA